MSFTLWVLAEPPSSEALLVVEQADGSMDHAVVLRDDASIRRFLAQRGMPRQSVSNMWSAVRFVREAEPRLFQVPATVLKPKELVGPLIGIALRAHRG
jgi:hypothetical protein